MGTHPDVYVINLNLAFEYTQGLVEKFTDDLQQNRFELKLFSNTVM